LRQVCCTRPQAGAGVGAQWLFMKREVGRDRWQWGGNVAGRGLGTWGNEGRERKVPYGTYSTGRPTYGVAFPQCLLTASRDNHTSNHHVQHKPTTFMWHGGQSKGVACVVRPWKGGRLSQESATGEPGPPMLHNAAAPATGEGWHRGFAARRLYAIPPNHEEACRESAQTSSQPRCPEVDWG